MPSLGPVLVRNCRPSAGAEGGRDQMFLHVRGARLAVAAVVAVVASLGGAAVAPSASAAIAVSCPAQNLQTALNSAPPDSIIIVTGTCTGDFTLGKNVKLVGPAILDGNATGTVVNVATGVTATLNSVTIRNGKSFSGGGISNSGTVILNYSTVTGNTVSGTQTIVMSNGVSC